MRHLRPRAYEKVERTSEGVRFLATQRLKWFVAFGVTIAGIGTVWQAVAQAADRRKFPPPGAMVDVGGHRLHVRCDGAGSPTVVLESGLGCCSLDWSLVQPEVATFTRVCS